MWTKEIFQVEKPVIAMLHLLALPGDPGYDREGGFSKILDRARKDLHALQDGGVDGVLISNEFSLPYLTEVKTETVASMARIIGELMPEIRVSYGVDVLWDPYKVFDLAVAVDAKFVREIFTGVYSSDFGLWNTNYGEVVRHRERIGAMGVKALFNIVPEAAKYVGDRDIVAIAKSTVFNCRPEALCVSGLTAGSPADTQVLDRVKKAVPDTVVFVNTGVRLENVGEQLRIADGAVVGTTFKRDGEFFNEVDQARVEAFMAKVRALRG